MGAPRKSRRARHILEYAAVLGLREPLRHLEPRRAIAVGAGIGEAWARAGGPRTRDAAINLRLAFPDWSDAERARVLSAAFANMGRHLAELCVMHGPHREELFACVDVEGHEHFEAAQRASESGGMIALTGHFGSWELSAAVMAERGYPLSVVGHPISNPRVQELVSGWRRRAGVEEIPLGRASAGVFRALSRGKAVAMLLDQNARAEEGVFAPFFGETALTRSGPAQIAMSRGTPIVPVFIHRVGSTEHHIVRFEAPLEIEPAGSDPDAALRRNVARMNAAIEAVVRERPEQWLWPHRRFKTRPNGEASPYPRRRRRRRRTDV